MKFVARVRETRSTIEGKGKGKLWELEESDTWMRSTLATNEIVIGIIMNFLSFYASLGLAL